tara:strand:+ start:1377 stop:1589 length:213 start_codon:yes stop_codon:yes gene_type:complete
MEEKYSENLNILTKQTVCDKNLCLEILKKNENDLTKALKECLNIKEEPEKECNTSNQERYRLMRNLLYEN